MPGPWASRQAWEDARAAAYLRMAFDLGMAHADAMRAADEEIGPWVEPVAEAQAPTPRSAPVEPAPAASVPFEPARSEPTPDSRSIPEATTAPPRLAEPPLVVPTRVAEVAQPEAPRPVARQARPGMAPQRAGIAAALVLVGALYCLAELAYNISLIEFVSSPNTGADAFENLERVGKALAAVGLSMFVARQARGFKALALFAVLSPLAYLAIDRGYDAAIESLPHQAKVEGYYLGAYRSLLLEGKLADADFPSGSGSSVEDKIKLANIPLAAGSGKDPEARVASYVYGADDARSFSKEIDGLWSVYASVSRKVDPLYAYYAIESKKAAAVGGPMAARYNAAFSKRSGGIPPGLDKNAFNAAVASQYPGLAKYRKAVAIPEQPAIGMPALLMGDIPPGLDQPAFASFIQGRIDAARAASKARADKVESLPHAHAVIGAAFVPPMSMSLSLLSFALNLALVASGLALLCARPLLGARGAGRLALAANLACVAVALGWLATRPPALTGVAAQWQARAESSSVSGLLWGKALNAEAALLANVSFALPKVHAAFIDDSRPAEVQRVAIQKAEPVDLGDMDARLAAFKAAEAGADAPPAVDPGFYADESKLNAPGYYGETRPTGGNPYVRK